MAQTAPKTASLDQDVTGTESYPIVDDAYRLYITTMIREEHEFLTNCNESMDSTLVFAGLFSAITSALIVETRKSLVPDPQDRVTFLLEALYDHATGTTSDIQPVPFSTPPWAVAVNLTFFIALMCSLLAGLGGLLVKQWARESAAAPKYPAPTREEARAHHKAWSGLSLWRVDIIIAAIPMLLHVALLLFFFGILWWLKESNAIIFGVLLYLISGAVILYVGMGIASAVHSNAPFKWPFSSALKAVGRALKRGSRNDAGDVPLKTIHPEMPQTLSRLFRSSRAGDLEADTSNGSGLSLPVPMPPKPKEFIQQSGVPSIDEASLCLVDEVDEDIFCKVLSHSVNRDELTSMLSHLYQTATSGSIQMQFITPRLVRISIEKCDELSRQCCNISDSPSVRSALKADSIWRARLCCRYLGWILASSQSRILSTRPPTRAVQLIRAFRDRAIPNEALEDMQLAIDVMCEVQKGFYLKDPDCNLDDVLNVDGIKLLLKKVPIYGTPSWDNIETFQTLVTNYIWPIINFVIVYASTNPAVQSLPTSSPQRHSSTTPLDIVSNIEGPSFLNEFPPSTPYTVIVACAEMRDLLARTDDEADGDNYPILLPRLISLWVDHGASGWAYIFLKGLLGPLRKTPETINGVRQVNALEGKSLAFMTTKDWHFFKP